MTYDSSAWTGRTVRRHFPLAIFMLVLPWFAIRIGPMLTYDCYGVELSWGYVPPAPIVARHEHYRRWVWWTAEELMDRR